MPSKTFDPSRSNNHQYLIQRMEPLPDLAAMAKKALEILLLELYDRSCRVFGDTFDVMHVVKVEFILEIS